MQRSKLKHAEGIATPLVEAVTPVVERTANRLTDGIHSLARRVNDGAEVFSKRRLAATGAVRDAVTAHPMRAIGMTLIAGLALGFFVRRH